MKGNNLVALALLSSGGVYALLLLMLYFSDTPSFGFVIGAVILLILVGLVYQNMYRPWIENFSSKELYLPHHMFGVVYVLPFSLIQSGSIFLLVVSLLMGFSYPVQDNTMYIIFGLVAVPVLIYTVLATKYRNQILQNGQRCLENNINGSTEIDQEFKKIGVVAGFSKTPLEVSYLPNGIALQPLESKIQKSLILGIGVYSCIAITGLVLALLQLFA